MGKPYEKPLAVDKRNIITVNLWHAADAFLTDEMDVGLPQTDIKGTDKASNLQSIIVQETDEYGSGLN